MDSIDVGIIGFGTVGTGVLRVLERNAPWIERRLGASLRVTRIADLDISRDRGVALEPGVLTTKAEAILDDPRIAVVVELIGGLEPARTYILRSMERGKQVVTANKALLALHGEELYEAARVHKVSLGFEASVGGGIPIIRALREGLVANRIGAIYGIINGTSNYILSEMTHAGKGFEEVLREAQAHGYAEADPALDVGGGDSAHKLAILASLAFGSPVDLGAVHTEGITRLTPLDIAFAKEFGYRIKLLAIAKLNEEPEGDAPPRSPSGSIEARVHPTMLPEDNLLSTVDGVYNAICVVGNMVGTQMFYGRGAGDLPTGSAVVSDLMEIARDLRSGSIGRVPVAAFGAEARRALPVRKMEVITSRYYLRFTAQDKPGVLSKIAGILGAHQISIESVIQKGRGYGEAVPVVMMSHESQEQNVRLALEEIDRSPVVTEPTVLIRVEA